MSYVVLCYTRNANVIDPKAYGAWVPACLYSNGMPNEPAVFYGVPQALDFIRYNAVRFGPAGDNTYRYSVHAWAGWDMPETCELPVNAHYLTRAYDWPEGHDDFAQCVGWGGDTFRNLEGARLDMPADPVALSPLPLNFSGPIVLSDGTVCAVHERSGQPGYQHYIQPLSRTALDASAHTYGWMHVEPETGHITNGPLRGQLAFNVVREPEAIRFEVRAGLNGTDRNEWGTVAEFLSGSEAGAWVKDNRERFTSAGKVLAIVRSDPKAVATDWREREAQRLTDGTYMPLPGNWGAVISRYYPDHYAHIAQSDKRKIAFTETESSGERDKQKVISAHVYAERYLTRNLSMHEVDLFVSDMMGDSVKPCFSPLGDADALEEVYCQCHESSHSVSSCMSHDVDDYSSPFHPVRVYAMGGEITLAFLRADEDGSGIDTSGQWDASGQIMARCLVWPEGKQYGRVYGDGVAARMLRTALENDGYGQGSLRGAKVAKVEHNGHLVLPYFDCGDGWATDCGDHLTVGGNDIAATQTSGLVDYCERTVCEHCDESVREDDTYTVYVGEDEPETWCPHCNYDGAFNCDHTGDRVSETQRFDYTPSGRIWEVSVARWLIENGTITADFCEDTGDYREDYFHCEDCSTSFSLDAIHDEHSDCCTSCGDEREASEAEAERQREEIEASEADSEGAESLPAAA